MRPASRFALRAALGLAVLVSVSSSGLEETPADKPPEVPLGWLEVTPIDQAGAPRFEPLFREGRFLGKLTVSGRVLACHTFEKAAISCRKLRLPDDGPLDLGRVEGVPLEGSVVLGRQPLDGARVSLVPDGLDAVRFFLMPLSLDAKGETLVRSVRSDRQGQFALPAVAPGRYLLEVQAPGGRMLHGEPFRVPSPEELRGRAAESGPLVFDLGEVRFDEGLRLEVQVTDSTGSPVAGAKVAAAQGDQPSSARFFDALANVAGVATIDGLEPLERISLSCHAAGYRLKKEEFERPPATWPCVLEPLSKLVGLILGPDGEPFPGALVALEGPALEQPAGKSIRESSAEDGTYSFVDLAAGHYRLTVGALDYASETQELEIAPGEQRSAGTIQLEPGSAWNGLVVDAVTGQGIESARVTSVQPPGAVSAVTDEEGAFRAISGGEDDLVLEVVAEDYPLSVFELRANELREDDVPALELARGGQIRISVWSSNEESPCSGCVIAVSDPSGGVRASLRTGVDGTATTELLKPGDYRVTLQQVGSKGSIVYRSGGDNVKEARVTPLQTTEVRFGEDRAELWVRTRPTLGSNWSLVATGPTGSEVRSLDGGRYRLTRPLGRTRLAIADSAGTTVELAVLPPDFSDRTLDLDLPSTEVKGVLSIEGEPLVATLVSFVLLGPPSLSATARTGVDGAFSAPHLEAGTYSLMVGNRSVKTFSLKAASQLDLGALDLPGAAAEGTFGERP